MSPLDAPRDPRNSDLEAGAIEAREAYAAARPRSAAIHAKARECMPGGNTRTVLFYTPFPTATRARRGRAGVGCGWARLPRPVRRIHRRAVLAIPRRASSMP